MGKRKKNNRKTKHEPRSYINLITAIVNLVTAVILLLQKLKRLRGKPLDLIITNACAGVNMMDYIIYGLLAVSIGLSVWVIIRSIRNK